MLLFLILLVLFLLLWFLGLLATLLQHIFPIPQVSLFQEWCPAPSRRIVVGGRRWERGGGGYFCFALSSTLSANSAPFMFCLALFKSTSFPCVEPVSVKYSFTIKLNTIDVHTINVKTKRYPLYHGGATQLDYA